MNINTRRDIVTNKRFERDELIRIAVLKNGETLIDKDYSKGGRGIYVHPTSIEQGINKNIIKSNINRFKGNWELILEKLKEEI